MLITGKEVLDTSTFCFKIDIITVICDSRRIN